MSYSVVLAQKEDAKGLLDYLKQIGSESDYLLFDHQGVPMTIEQEEAFLNTVNSTPYSRMFLIKDGDKVIANGYIYVVQERVSNINFKSLFLCLKPIGAQV